MRSIISRVRGLDEHTNELILTFTDDKTTHEISISAKNAAKLAGEMVRWALEAEAKNESDIRSR